MSFKSHFQRLREGKKQRILSETLTAILHSVTTVFYNNDGDEIEAGTNIDKIPTNVVFFHMNRFVTCATQHKTVKKKINCKIVKIIDSLDKVQSMSLKPP